MLALPIRRIIYIIFILLFLITAPILVLYTAGYRYNFKKGGVQKVGSISVKAHPKEAKIYLDNQLRDEYRSDDTLRITNLFPGKYQIGIRLDGYHPWEKTLDVFSNINTFVNQAVLFNIAGPENISQEKIIQSLSSPDQKKIVYLTAKQLIVINFNNLQTTLLTNQAANFKIISWSPNSNQLLVKDNKYQFIIYNLANPQQKLSLQTITKIPLEKVNWNSAVNYLLYGWANNNFYQINILTKEYRVLHHFPLIANQSYGPDFFYQNNKIYYTNYTQEGLFLEKINLAANREEEKVKQLMKLPLAGAFFFYPNDNGTIGLLDPAKQKFYLIAENFDELILEVKAKDFRWSADNKKLLYYNDFEIWLYDLETKNSKLITRYGQIINQVKFLPKIEYLIFLVNNSLEIIELDNRDKRNVVELIKSENINHFFIGPKGKNIYFTGQIGSQEGLFKLGIQK